MSLTTRKLSLQTLIDDCNFHSFSGLIIFRQLSSNPAYHALKDAIKKYIFSSLSISDSSNFLEEIDANYLSYINITPNGSLAPKSEFAKEYNLIISCYNDLLADLKLDRYIVKHHFPIHIRIKKYFPDKESNFRPHATELVHSDAWAGESSEAVNLHIPLWGDAQKNHMKFFMPPDSFQTDWLKHIENYSVGEPIATLYSPVDFQSSIDTAVISDLSTLHKTHIEPEAGIRISLDTTFLNKKVASHDETEYIHQNRDSEMLDFYLFKSLGKSRVLKFTKSINDPINDSKAFAIGYEWSLIEDNK